MATNIQSQKELCILPVFSLRVCVMLKQFIECAYPVSILSKIKVLSHSQSVTTVIYKKSQIY